MKTNLILLIFSLLFTACGEKPTIPSDAEDTRNEAMIYPDYKGVTVPPNIAPLNFLIKGTERGCILSVKTPCSTQVVSSSTDGTVQWEENLWKKVLNEAKGKNLTITIYKRRNDGKWLRHPSFSIFVAEDMIDEYLSYRLIEPGYEVYRQVGLYQRHLTDFDVHTIYENNRSYQAKENHCVNCHNYQNYDAGTMLFHVRTNHGGTIIAKEGQTPEKIDMSCDSTLSLAVYPSWHPKKHLIAFSSNKTGQTFHVSYKEKIEVVDSESDLLLYDADSHTIQNILKTSDHLETFPCWSPDGKRLFYCDLFLPDLKEMPDSMKTAYIVEHYNTLRYNIMSMSFDEKSHRFSQPRMEVNCAETGKSASVPRISPDGNYLLFTLADYGQFHIWHKSSDLYIKNLKTGIVAPLSQANSKDVDSYHAWSSNGRWIVFSSRRDDGSFTRLYISYLDKNGDAHKAFLLPQKDPAENLALIKSYNVPEFSRNKVPYSAKSFKKTIYDDEHAIKVKYRSAQ